MCKIFSRLSLFLVAGAMALTACIPMPKRNSLENGGGDGVPLTYRFDGGDDMTSLFTLKATYVGANGKNVTEQIRSLPWSKKIAVPTPFEAQLRVRFERKANPPQRTSYAVGYAGRIDLADEQSVMQGVVAPTRADAGDGVVRLRFTLPEGVSPEGVSLRFAPLKYDKHFAFTFTCDDSYTNAYSRIWSLIHAKWIDDREFRHPGASPSTGYVPDHPLVMTDGCGNDRRFGFSCAIWPSWGNDLNVTFIKDMALTGVNSMYISWEELALLSDFGVSMLYHNVDERVYSKKDPAQIVQGLHDDYDRVLRKLGLRLKVLGLPDGNAAYAEAAQMTDLVVFTRNALNSASRIRLHTCGDLSKGETYGGDNNSIISRKLTELATQAASNDPYWVGITVHRCGEDYMQMLEEIYQHYGKAGSDALWVASWDEIFEYVHLREGAQIRKSVAGRTVTFELEMPTAESDLFRDVSLLVEGLEGAWEVEPLTNNVVGLAHAPRGDAELLNVNFNPRLPALAEKYTAKYEQDFSPEALDDARYFVSQLLPSLAAPLEQRLGSIVPPSQGQLDAARIEAYCEQLDGHTAVVGREVPKQSK